MFQRLLPLLFAFAGVLPGAEGEIVFRSAVTLVRVDAQVLDGGQRAVTGLQAGDFILREEGRPQEIRNFSTENMPVDVLLLLDVSGSMRPHVERIASAAHEALQVLGGEDRVAIMVFDRATRLRLPFRNSRQEVERGLETLLAQESFNGGTDITRGLLDAAQYVSRSARPEARRAIVILTDDQTERGRDEAEVGRALTRADAVLSALLAPDAMGRGRRFPGTGGGPWGWPGGSPGGSLPDIIWGRRGPSSRRGPVTIGSQTQSAGTAEIARRSGGDSMSVDQAAALETTLARIRQRYALHFYLPEGARPGEERRIEVELADAARRRYPGAEVRFRQVYLAPGGAQDSSAPVTISSAAEPESQTAPAAAEPAPKRGGWRRVDEPEPTAEPVEPETEARPSTGRWRRVKPGEAP
jgi:VWFA-related protein